VIERYVALRERVDPLTATTPADQRAFLEQAEAPLVLVERERAFGAVMRFPPESDADLKLGVVAEARGRGLGSELLERLLAHAREQGWASALASVSDDASRAWAERRGFGVVDREERVVLELPAAVPDAPTVDLLELTLEGLEDVPGELARLEQPDLETWLAWQRAPSRRPDFLVIALDGGEPVAFAQLNVYPRVGHHAFTVVARSHRGRGLARELKRELIRRAQARGPERLITQSNEDNVAMRSLNAELGYEPAAPLVFLRKGLAG
jgi:GNAT superfamily N-acetyltransferase